MPDNKKALVRYQVYDNCFRNKGRRYTWKDLVTKVNEVLEEYGYQGIRKTQFYDDIKFMQYSHWQAPIVKTKDGKWVHYSYEDKSYSINNHLLSEEDVNQLKSALSILSRFQGMPQFEWVHEMIAVIESKMGLVTQAKEIISFDANIDYVGLKHISRLFDAIAHRRVVEITYQRFSESQAEKFTFHPYHLRQYNHRWFVLGFYPEKGVPRWNLALDRILQIQELDEKYVHDTTDWDDHFFDIVGVTRKPGKCEEVKLLFTSEQAPYIETKPLHPTQKHNRNEDGKLEVTINVVPNFELEMQILSFGEKVKVLAPENLRERIVSRLQSSFSQY